MTADRDPTTSGADATAAIGTDATAALGTDATVAAGLGPGREATLAAPVAPVVLAEDSLAATAATLAPSDAGVTTARTVGDDLQAASIERFTEVARDRFELLGELARGGLGRVFRARDPRTSFIA